MSAVPVPTTPNMIVVYVDAATGAVVGHDSFFDPYLAWARTPDGDVVLRTGWGCGRPTEAWLRQNPRPAS